jgi:hypothetical protein
LSLLPLYWLTFLLPLLPLYWLTLLLLLPLY